MDFLDKIRPLLTDADVEIGVDCIPINCSKNLRTILTNLVPMLDRVRSLYCHNDSALPILKEQLFSENEKLAKLKFFDMMVLSDTGLFMLKTYFKNFDTF